MKHVALAFLLVLTLFPTPSGATDAVAVKDARSRAPREEPKNSPVKMFGGLIFVGGLGGYLWWSFRQ